MLTLSAKIRKEIGKKVKDLRKKGILPAVLYGPEIKNLPLEIDLKEFEKIYKEAGESSVIKLKIPPQRGEARSMKLSGKHQKAKNGEISVLIKEVVRDPLTEKFLHVDFYQPKLKEEVEAMVPLVFEGEAKAVKDFGGTFIKNISEVEVRALPLNLPKEIKVDIEKLKTFEDSILIRDLRLPEGVKILKDPEETVALVSPPEKVEEELEKPIEEKVIEEKVEEGEKVEEKKEPSSTKVTEGKGNKEVK
ncbi:50S ribosomal protein L25 [Patescibacteria group bacterium]|nr:50S ribosomal protein L25 [Patescibacteria group bacterium]